MNYSIIIGIICLIVSILIAVELSKKFTDRRKFFADFYDFNQILINEIYFSKKTIPYIINENFKDDSLFYKLLKEYFIEKKIEFKNVLFLTEKENAFLNKYIEGLGGTDVKSQESYFLEVRSQIKPILDEVNELEKRNKSLYVKIGVLIGFAILIVLM